MAFQGSEGDASRSVLASMHERHSTEPIEGADPYGAFREPFLSSLLADALPIVVDANVLRNDVGRTCRLGRRTVLITGANTRAFRLYCAQHVVEEVAKHGARWASDMKVEYAAFADVWQGSYLPLLRHVPTDSLDHLLLEDERARVKYLGSMRDPDDVPSATLALAIGALFLTEDKAAYEAVHGTRVDTAQLRGWLDPLRDGGDAAELQQMFSLSLAVPMLGLAGVWNAARWLYSRSRLAFISAGVTAAGVMLFTPAESYRKAWAFSKDVVSRIGDDIVMPQLQATDRIRSALPPFPEWNDLVQGTGRDAALTRACLYRLARCRKAPLHAGELANELPMLGIGQAASRVGKMLWGNPCFFQPHPKQWQVGRPIET